jgi:hypothetical protein
MPARRAPELAAVAVSAANDRHPLLTGVRPFAAARMSWALAAIGTVYPAPSVTRAPGPRPLAFAS